MSTQLQPVKVISLLIIVVAYPSLLDGVLQVRDHHVVLTRGCWYRRVMGRQVN